MLCRTSSSSAAARQLLLLARRSPPRPVRSWPPSSPSVVRWPARRGALQARLQSSSASVSSSSSASSASPALAGGLAGGALAFAVCYLWYHFSGLKTVVQASKQAQGYLSSAKHKLAEATPDVEPSEALQWLRSTALSQASLIPGAKTYVNAAFDDLDKVRQHHGDEVDQAVRDTYADLRGVVHKDGLTLDAASKVWHILAVFADRVGSLAGDAAQDILDNHPQLRDQVGDGVDQLKRMGDAYGPQVRKEVDSVWGQVEDIFKAGSGPDAISKVSQLIQERTTQVRGMVDDAWKKGMDQAKPYLDRNPKLQQLVDQNQDALKDADFSRLWDLVKQAADSGNTADVEKFVRDKTQHAVSDTGIATGGALDQLLKSIPGGDQLGPKIEMLQDVAQKRGKEAENLLRETMDEIQDVLKRRTDQAQQLADDAKQDAEKGGAGKKNTEKKKTDKK